MAINEEDLSILVQKYLSFFDKGIKNFIGKRFAPEICLSKFVILIQALLFLFNNVAAAFLRRRRRSN